MGSVVYACTKLVIGQLYPAYASFKAVKNRNVKVGFFVFIAWTDGRTDEPTVRQTLIIIGQL